MYSRHSHSGKILCEPLTAIVRLFQAACFFFSLPAVAVHASITMTGTRIIYNGAAKSTDVHLKNKDAIPYVVQSWFDNGNMADGPDKSAQVPFIATPPAFRIQHGEGQVIRIIYTCGKALPQDRNHWFILISCRSPPMPDNQQAKPKNKTVC